MTELLVETIKWAVNVGTAALVLFFLAAVAWQIIFGAKGRIGLLGQWELRRSKHEEEQTAMGIDERAATKAAEVAAFNNASNLHVLVASETPPKGAAYVAQALVAKTAVTVDQLQMLGTEFVEIIRHLASQFPEVKKDIYEHCDNIEREVKRSTDDLLREQTKLQEQVKDKGETV